MPPLPCRLARDPESGGDVCPGQARLPCVSWVWSHVWRTCWIALRVAITSAFQLCGLDMDAPVDRGPFIALWTVGPPLYLAITSACPYDGNLCVLTTATCQGTLARSHKIQHRPSVERPVRIGLGAPGLPFSAAKTPPLTTAIHSNWANFPAHALLPDPEGPSMPTILMPPTAGALSTAFRMASKVLFTRQSFVPIGSSSLAHRPALLAQPDRPALVFAPFKADRHANSIPDALGRLQHL